MSQFKVITTNTNNVWDSKKRYKVNSVVSHNDILYQNITGKNSSPDTLVDWIVSKALDFLCIPLRGTAVGNPVTGNIEIVTGYGETHIFKEHIDEDWRGRFSFSDSFLQIASEKISDSNGTTTSFNKNHVEISSTIPTSDGIVGAQDFSQNLTLLSYTQKVYVDSLRGKHISKTTTEINAIATPQAGETYFNTTLSTLCFYDGTAWKRVSHSAM